MKIVELRTENFMGIKLAEVRPGADMVIVSGQNGQGKTSLLDSIECAIRGKKFHPDRPVRQGANSAEVKLDLGDLKIRRRFSADGGGTITVERADGFKAPRPQEVLDSLAGAISFDPLEFARMDPKERLRLVRELAGVDTSDLERQRQECFEARTDRNRETKALEARLAGLDRYPDAPDAPVSLKDLLAELDAAQENNREWHDLHTQRDRATSEVRLADAELERLRAQIAEVEEDKRNAVRIAAVSAAKLESMCEIECDDIHRQIQEAEQVNQQVAANARHAEMAAEAAESAKQADALSEQIKQLDAEKARLIASASLPVPGLSFSERDGVTLDSIPFEQRSSAEKLDASVRIGMALNPRLHVMLVRDGCVLDDQAMVRLGEIAADHDYQLFVERVGTSDAGAIVISEGEIVSGGAA